LIFRYDRYEPSRRSIIVRIIFSKQVVAAATFGSSLLAALLASTVDTHAADVKVLSTVGLTPALDELAPTYERGGNHLVIVYDTIAKLKKRIEDGETADVIILSRPVLDEFAAHDKLAKDSTVNIGMSYVAIGVRVGAPVPDISTPEKLKAVLLAARSISYADPSMGGASGVYFFRVLERLGIADQMKSKTILVPNAQAGERVASGEAEIGVAQASEIAAVPGAHVVGPLPGDLNSEIMFAAGIGSASQNSAAAKSLLDLLTSATGVATLRSKGMDPAR
jgi:molybdate transport system substrate-binding protein